MIPPALADSIIEIDNGIPMYKCIEVEVVGLPAIWETDYTGTAFFAGENNMNVAYDFNCKNFFPVSIYYEGNAFCDGK